jgi:hypothetical protein
MNDLISDKDKERFENQLEESTEIFSFNKDDDVYEDENGFFIESRNSISKENIKMQDIKSEVINTNENDEQMKSQVYKKFP